MAFLYKQNNFAMILYRLYVRRSLSHFTVFVNQYSYLMMAEVDSQNTLNKNLYSRSV